MAKFIWDITHSEEFTTKEWEIKKKYTKVWALFYNEEYKTYSVNFLWQWLNVFPKKDNTAKEEEISIESMPF